MNKKKTASVLLTFFILFYALLGKNVLAYEIVIDGSGSGSDNEVVVNVETETVVESSNEANVTNEVDTSLNTGGNEVIGNTGEVASVETGDISEEVVVGNSMNYSDVEVGCCDGEGSDEIVISNNGDGSTNHIDVTSETTNQVDVYQLANITNQVDGNSNTGRNEVSNNSSNASVDTGNITVAGYISNGPVNFSNISIGGNNFTPNSLNLMVDNNAGNSENIINYSSSRINSSNYDFIANLFNFVDWDLNTGGNLVNSNLGNTAIKTGDIFFNFGLINSPINTGQTNVGCCGDPNGPIDPVDPVDPGKPVDPGNPGNGGNGGDNGGSGGDSGEAQGAILASAYTTEAIAQVLGLSDTGKGILESIFFWTGVLMLVGGTRFAAEGLKSNRKRTRFFIPRLFTLSKIASVSAN